MKDQDIRVTYAWRDVRDGRERTIATVLSDAMFVGVDQAQRTKVNRELCRLLVRYTGSEMAATVWRVTGLNGRVASYSC